MHYSGHRLTVLVTTELNLLAHWSVRPKNKTLHLKVAGGERWGKDEAHVPRAQGLKRRGWGSQPCNT